MADSAASDRDRLLALLDEWGVGYNGENAQRYAVHEDGSPSDVLLCKGDAKIDGYNGFFARFEFDEAGTFTGVSVWE